MAALRRPAKPRRSKTAQNIVDNTPASGWQLATKHEKIRLDVNPHEPRYVRKDAKQVRKGSINLTRDEFTKGLRASPPQVGGSPRNRGRRSASALWLQAPAH